MKTLFTNFIIPWAICMTIIVMLIMALIVGQDRKALSECNEWSTDIALHPDHLDAYEQWQKDQCDFYHISLSD